ncbi:zinc finger protein 583 isoform X1 [Sigmodon hispidus]
MRARASHRHHSSTPPRLRNPRPRGRSQHALRRSGQGLDSSSQRSVRGAALQPRLCELCPLHEIEPRARPDLPRRRARGDAEPTVLSQDITPPLETKSYILEVLTPCPRLSLYVTHSKEYSPSPSAPNSGIPVSKPAVISLLEQGKDPWMVQKEGARNVSPDWDYIFKGIEFSSKQDTYEESAKFLPMGRSHLSYSLDCPNLKEDHENEDWFKNRLGAEME